MGFCVFVQWPINIIRNLKTKQGRKKRLKKCLGAFLRVSLVFYSWDKHTKRNSSDCSQCSAEDWTTSAFHLRCVLLILLITYTVKLHCGYIHTFNDYSVFRNSNKPTRCAEVSCIWLLVKLCIQTSTYKLGLRSQPCLYTILKAISIIKCVAIALICWNHYTELMRHLFSDVGQIIVHGML